MKTCVAIRHVAFEDLGSFGDVLADRGVQIRYFEAGVDDLSQLDSKAADLLVVLGGPIGAYEEHLYPFLMDEMKVIESRLKAGLPVLGICLGAQLMARTLGGRVYPNPAGKEIGWSRLSLTEAGSQSPVAPLAEVEVLHWHGDTFDLPHGAQLLASTPITPNQAFLWGDHGLALQFHPEVTARRLERWYIGHAAEIAHTTGVDVPELRTRSRLAAPLLEPMGRRVLSEWIDRLGG